MTVPGSFDSLVAKIIVTGADRLQAVQRARRALAETVLEGMPSVLPFHAAVLDEPAFVAADGTFGVRTRWIGTEFDNRISPYTDAAADPGQAERQSFVVEVDGRRLRVRLPADLVAPARPASASTSRPSRRGGAAPTGRCGLRRSHCANAGAPSSGSPSPRAIRWPRVIWWWCWRR